MFRDSYSMAIFIVHISIYLPIILFSPILQVISSMKVLMTEDSNEADSNSFLLDDSSTARYIIVTLHPIWKYSKWCKVATRLYAIFEICGKREEKVTFLLYLCLQVENRNKRKGWFFRKLVSVECWLEGLNTTLRISLEHLILRGIKKGK